MNCPPEFEKSRPKEPTIYKRAGFCRIHRKTKLVKDDHECCWCCCGGCDPKYSCPTCEENYNRKMTAWLNLWGHIVAVADFLHVENGTLTRADDVRYMRFLHGGKPIKVGSWCKVNEKGFVVACRKPSVPNMIVVS